MGVSKFEGYSQTMALLSVILNTVYIQQNLAKVVFDLLNIVVANGD